MAGSLDRGELPLPDILDKITRCERSGMSLVNEVGEGLDGLGQLRALMASGRKPPYAQSKLRKTELFVVYT